MAPLKGTARLLWGSTAEEIRPIADAIVLGRDNADVVLSDSEVSRRHTILRPVADGIEIEDLGSTNGTYVDDQRVDGKVTITKTATVRLGNTQLTIEVPAAAAGDLAPLAPDARPPAEVTAARQIPPGLAAGAGAGADAPAPSTPPSGRATAPPAAAGSAAPPPPSKAPPRPRTPASASRAPRSGAKRRVGRLLPLVVAVLLLGVVVVPIFASAFADFQIDSGASVCAKHFPRVIRDGFPEPAMRFSKHGVLDTTLREATGSMMVNGSPVPTFQYEGGLPGPTLVVCPGDELVVHLQNRLPLPTNLHVHGLHVSPQGNSDNVFIGVGPQQNFTYQIRIPNDQSPGSFWYHPHFHPLVQPEISGGLAGAIVVEGGLDNVLAKIPQRLMVIQGGKDVPGPSGPLPLPGGAPLPPALPGPGRLLVNGVVDPTVKIRPGEIQRWRIFNATAGRILRLKMPGETFQVLAEDGATLRNVRPATQLDIGPGSRREVLVRGAAAGRYQLAAVPFQQCFSACFDPRAGITNSGRISTQETVLTMASAGVPARDKMPGGALDRGGRDLRKMKVDVHRTIVLARVVSPTMPPVFPLDGKVFDPNRVDVTMKLNSVEEWTVKNTITPTHNEWHTLHIHQNPFQVISRDGKPLDYVDYEDNVLLAPGETVVIRLHPTDFVGKFVFHCHLTFHEDQGMMAVAQVLANPTAAQVKAGSTVDFGMMPMSYSMGPMEGPMATTSSSSTTAMGGMKMGASGTAR